MKHEIERMAKQINFGVDDLLSVDAVLVKKYLIIYRLSKTYPIFDIAYEFNYRNTQSVYSAIRKVRGWIEVRAEVRGLYEELQ
jgi:hypothetical protein